MQGFVAPFKNVRRSKELAKAEKFGIVGNARMDGKRQLRKDN
jgi:hypothetical protein